MTLDKPLAIGNDATLFRGLDGRDYVIFHASVGDPASEKKEQMIICPIKYTPDGGCEIG